ncbi:MAG: D-alanyl-D-alanine carboxypeptidase/D-alanyl-D-alanine-endopeptidase [Actinobacteria bacterium]|nr:D-alanyl-D-alanine carboxypeptidase/D-alanyl-D-alanine-endopeptidase [Actinomycetota bacterium]
MANAATAAFAILTGPAPAASDPSGSGAGRLARRLAAWTVGNPETGAVVWRLDSGGPVEVLAYRPTTPFAPASTMKVVTAASALINLGADFRFETKLIAGARSTLDGGVFRGPLYVKGYGDPVLSTPRYARAYFGGSGGNVGRLVRPLRALGVRRVIGPLVADETFLDTARIGTGWSASDRSECPPLTGLVVNQSYAGDDRGRPTSAPPISAARHVRRSMTALGIVQTGQLRSGTAPAVGRPIGAVRSPPLSRIIRLMLPESDNFIAETLTRDVGAYLDRSGTTVAGTDRAEATVRTLGGLGPGEDVVDGSGLSRANRLSAATLTSVLTAASEDDGWGRALISGLPRGGEGTLLHRLRGSVVRTRVRAKTGSIDGVSSLAGIVRSTSGTRYVFAFLMNGPDDKGARTAQDSIVRLLANGAGDAAPGRAVTRPSAATR